jgi:hypothetical protein
LKNPGTLILKNDNFKLGVILGLIAPMIIFILLYYIKFSSYEFDKFLEVFRKENRLITFFSVWCLVGNIAVFTLYINTNKYQTAKGVFVVTLLYGVMFLFLKLFN